MRREEKKNQLEANEWFTAPMCSTCFGHFYAHHQELETICVLLPPMVCNALVAGCRRSGTEQQAMRPGWGMLLQQHPSSRKPSLLGIKVPETCWAHYKCNKLFSGIYLDVLFISTHTVLYFVQYSPPRTAFWMRYALQPNETNIFHTFFIVWQTWRWAAWKEPLTKGI